MRTFIKRFIMFFLLIILVSFNIHTQGNTSSDIRFTNLSLEDGLYQTTVIPILQTSRGFMWFGTQEGSNQYDSYIFRVYRNDAGGNNVSDTHDNDGAYSVLKIILGSVEGTILS